ncbi:MAG: TatD family hydrolase [Propionibacteriaceae bacterium]|nr:TatD family hydrolase [Propionibacteriaceae bacterium]
MSVIDELKLPPLPEPLPRPVVDNHTHFPSTQRFSGLSAKDSLDLASTVGVTRAIDVGVDLESSREAIALALTDPRVVASVALHPNHAAHVFEQKGHDELNAQLLQIPALAAFKVVRSIGETGLDHFRTRSGDGRRAQVHSFLSHIKVARELDLTLMIHDRDAHQEILDVLDSTTTPERVVMHCFSGDADFARECVARGYWISLPGVVTFGTAEPLRLAAREVPLDKLLVETDAPYLTPKPQRGKPNAPYLLPHTVRFVADLLEVDLAAFCDQLVSNTFDAYGGPWGEDA